MDGDDDNDDYDEESIISMNTDMFETPSSNAITTSFLIEEPKDYLIMEDEDINTIPKKESDEENESSVENLFHIPSESEVTFDNESECDLPIFDDFSSLYDSEDDCVIFSRPLFDSYGDTTSSEYSSDNESILEEDVFSNLPFEFDKESISSDVNPIYDEVLEDIDCTNSLIDSFPSGNDDISFDFEADPREIKSLLNQDALITSPKIDSLLEEFSGELTHIDLIPPRIDKVDFDHEEDIRLIKKLLYDNSSSRPSEELNSKISIKSFSPSPIPAEDSNSLMEEIDTFLASNDSIPPGIDSDGYDSEEDNLFF
ncbi:hypothetical protein Tco_1352557 [Tanacetum coccineum]